MIYMEPLVHFDTQRVVIGKYATLPEKSVPVEVHRNRNRLASPFRDTQALINREVIIVIV